MRKIFSSAFILTSLIVFTYAFTAQSATQTHVLLISVDGLHQSDVDWYVKNYPQSTIAKIANGGVEFTNGDHPGVWLVESAKHAGAISRASKKRLKKATGPKRHKKSPRKSA